MNQPRLQIIRGMPGSGKTTLAVSKYPHLMRVETDMYFTRGNRYTFTLDLNRKAVKWFNKTVADLAKTGMDFVVTGVFAAHTERLAATVSTALEHGYSVYIKTLHNDFGNIHKVPKAHLDGMRRAFVPDATLRKAFRLKDVHFGLMSPDLKVPRPQK